MNNENEVVQLYLDDIIPNRFQPREVFDDQALKELAISIREHGVIQPILVRKFGDKYEIIAGERRYKASTMAGLTKIPAIVKNLDDKESSKVALIENLQRRDLTPIEEARTYQKILDLDEMTQEDLAKTMGKSQSAVSNKLRLLSLPDEIQEALLKEKISERHARSLLNIEDKNQQINLLKEIIDNRMSVRDLDIKIKKMLGNDDVVKDEKNEENKLVTNEPVEMVIGNDNSMITTNNVNLSNIVNNVSDNAVITNPPEEEKKDNLEVVSSIVPPSQENGKPEETNGNNESISENKPTNMFDSLGIPEVSIPVNNVSSIANDPTVVDINNIREQTADIKTTVEEEKKDIESLIRPSKEVTLTNMGETLPKFEEKKDNSISFGANMFNDFSKNDTLKVNENNSNTGINLNDLLKNDSLMNETNSSFAEVKTDSIIEESNNREVVEKIRNIVDEYKNKGINISCEELDLDREVQLIIKVNKD